MNGRKAKREHAEEAKTAQMQEIEASQFPIIHPDSPETVVGYVTMLPELVDDIGIFGLQPGVDDDNKLIMFRILQGKDDKPKEEAKS